MLENNEIMVSIIMPAYNHESYIRQAIESILMQKTEYKFELIIGDDVSSDKTRNLIREYYTKHPDLIVPLLREHNLGATKNGYDMFLRAKGKYIACCDGDDFWCDEGRLQRHVEFLESNPDFIGICDKCKVVDEFSNPIYEEDLPPSVKFWKNESNIYKIDDFIKWQLPGHISAITARNIFLNKNHNYQIFYKAHHTVADRTIVMLLSLQGNICCEKKIVSCYRYRIEQIKTNFMSDYQNKNMRADDFLMIRRLEHYASREFGVMISIDKIKMDRLIGSVVVFLKDPSKHNWNVICSIIKYSEYPIKYIYLAIKAAVVKLYYWHILKNDDKVTF